MPYDSSNPEAFLSSIESIRQMQQEGRSSQVHVVCRRGNDSQLVVSQLRKAGISDSRDLIGGLQAWAKQQDNSFPLY